MILQIVSGLPKRVIPCAQIAVGDKKDAYDVGDMNGNFFSLCSGIWSFYLGFL